MVKMLNCMVVGWWGVAFSCKVWITVSLVEDKDWGSLGKELRASIVWGSLK